MTLAIFLGLRVLSTTRAGRELVRIVGGVLSLTTPPSFWLLLAGMLGRGPVGINPPRIWLVLELGICVAWAILYLFAKWPVPGWMALIFSYCPLWLLVLVAVRSLFPAVSV
jgi:hypothetical protein